MQRRVTIQMDNVFISNKTKYEVNELRGLRQL